MWHRAVPGEVAAPHCLGSSNLRVLSVFLGWPKLLWFVTESKHLSKPPRDWFPHIKDANNDTAYIEVSPRASLAHAVS